MASPTERMAWPDAARGVSILGVMLLHSTMVVPSGVETSIETANRIFGTLRMPLFFMVAGFFAVKVYRFNLLELFTKRLWFLLVPYVFWMPIEVFLARLKFHLNYGFEFPEPKFYWLTMRNAENLYWFLWSLIFFTIVLWVTKFLPKVVSYAIPIVVIALTPYLILHLHPWLMAREIMVLPRILTYLPPFLFGAYARPYIAWFAERALTKKALMVSAALVVVARVLHLWQLQDHTRPVKDVFASLVLLPMAITISVAIAKVPLVGSAITLLGRHTLVAYLGHPIALSVVFGILLQDGLHTTVSPEAWIAFCFVVSLLSPVAMHGLTKVPILRWTIFPPKLARDARTSDVKKPGNA